MDAGSRPGLVLSVVVVRTCVGVDKPSSARDSTEALALVGHVVEDGEGAA